MIINVILLILAYFLVASVYFLSLLSIIIGEEDKNKGE